jgi:hypothetical protein
LAKQENAMRQLVKNIAAGLDGTINEHARVKMAQMTQQYSALHGVAEAMMPAKQKSPTVYQIDTELD